LSGDYEIGLLTIITGLAIADVVVSLHGLLVSRARVRWDWLALLAALFIVLLIVAIWGISYRSMGNRQINPPLWLFAARLAQIIPMYLAARAALPDCIDDDGVVLADHYAANSRYFWASVAVTYVLYIAFIASTTGAYELLATYFSPTIQLAMMAVLVATPRRAVHALLVPAIVAMFCYDHLLLPMFG
jgi:uncharacterized membrane protein